MYPGVSLSKGPEADALDVTVHEQSFSDERRPLQDQADLRVFGRQDPKMGRETFEVASQFLRVLDQDRRVTMVKRNEVMRDLDLLHRLAGLRIAGFS